MDYLTAGSRYPASVRETIRANVVNLNTAGQANFNLWMAGVLPASGIGDAGSLAGRIASILRLNGYGPNLQTEQYAANPVTFVSPSHETTAEGNAAYESAVQAVLAVPPTVTQTVQIQGTPTAYNGMVREQVMPETPTPVTGIDPLVLGAVAVAGLLLLRGR